MKLMTVVLIASLVVLLNPGSSDSAQPARSSKQPMVPVSEEPFVTKRVSLLGGGGKRL